MKRMKRKIWAPKGVWQISGLMLDHGFKLYLVGGCVRDSLTGEKPKDYDLATDAHANEVIDLLKPYFRVDTQGAKFGVIAAYGGGLPKDGVEIATFRQDSAHA